MSILKQLIILLIVSTEGFDQNNILYIHNDEGLDLRKVSGEYDLSRFSDEISHLDCYLDALKFPLERSFGLYVLYDNDQPFALQSITPSIRNKVLIGSEMIDVIESYQGKKIGTKFRKETACYIQRNFLGKIQLTSVNDKEKAKVKLPLQFLHSSNEWCWGDNIGSLKSSLNAGYKVAAVGGFGTIQLLYTNDPIMTGFLWSDEKVSLFLQIFNSKKLEDNLNSAELTDLINKFLKLLDLSQEVDIVTILNLHDHAKRPSVLENTFYKVWRESIDEFKQNLTEEYSRNISTYSQGSRLPKSSQHILVDWLEFCEWRDR